MNLRAFALIGVGVISASACTDGAEGQHLESAQSAIVRGTDSDPSQDAAVLVMQYDALSKGGGAASGCSGTLLARRLVLTARHCVSVTDAGALCDAKGQPVSGGAVESDHRPSSLYVFAGHKRPDFLAGDLPGAHGAEILTTGATTLCNNDIALIVLDRDLDGGKIAPIRLDAPPVKGETVTVVGWGISEQSSDPEIRQQRTGVKILDVGPIDDLGPTEFRVGEGTCSGDSGGPAFAATGAVLGALSRGGNGKPSSGADGCIGAENILTSVAGHADFLRSGYEKVGQEPWLEGQPNPLLGKLGAVCTTDDECQSNACDTEAKVCAEECPDSGCPSHQLCAPRGSRRLCVKASGDDGGCSVTPTNEPSVLFLLAVLCVAVKARRSRKQGDGEAGRI